MSNKIDRDADRFCPVYDIVIDDDLCYDTVMVMKKAIKPSAIPELENIDVEAVRAKCLNCPYSNLD